MPSVQILNKIALCEDIGSLWRVFCLPKRVNCNAGCRDQILAPCDKTYNCSKAQGMAAYYLPALAGDKFQIQTAFVDEFNPDMENPVTGWGAFATAAVSAELCDSTGVVTADVTAFTTRRMYAWNGSNSYQIIELDIDLISALITGNCFNVKLYSHKASGTVLDTLCTQDFKIEEDCKDTVLIGSTFVKSDCCTNWYDDPVTFVGDEIKYNNTLRYRASISFTGGNNTKVVQRVDSTIDARKVDIQEVYEINFRDAMPDFLAKHLLKTHMAGKSVQVDDETYFIDEFTLDSAIRCKFNSPIEVYRFCENKFNC